MTTVPLAAPPRPAEADPGTPRLLAGADPTGAPPRLSAAELIELAHRAGLTGRGGAGFPLWRKLAAVAAGRRRPVVVANGAEGEPASRKDGWLLSQRPAMVLDGLAVAAGALRAEEAYLYVGSAEVAARLARLTAARRATREDPVRVTAVTAPAGFLAGEETAAVDWLGGGPGRPTSRPPLVAERGLRGRPTLVSNVETLVHLGLIARYGAEWFRRVGTPAEPGSLLVTVSGAVRRAGVVEVPHGYPLADLLALAGGATERLSALLVGGYHGGWLAAEHVGRATMSRPVLAGLGASLGAGIVAALPASRCGLAETARIVGYLADQSAGQCGPCLNGLPRIAALTAVLAGGRSDRRMLTELHRVAGLVEGRGACRHPDGTVRLLRSALGVFAADVEAHLYGDCLAADGRSDTPVSRPTGAPR